jgi:hypothetical protein
MNANQDGDDNLLRASHFDSLAPAVYFIELRFEAENNTDRLEKISETIAEFASVFEQLYVSPSKSSQI